MSPEGEIANEHGGSFLHELTIAAAAARAAGEIALAYHGTEIQVELKPGDEPVTIADRECSALIVETLKGQFSNDIVISEEMQDDPRRLSTRRVWYVDPIDGTKGFVRGEQGYCVMIGLTIDDKPVAGVVYQPNQDSLVFASQGSGTWAQVDGKTQRLGSSSISDLAAARLLASKVDRTSEVDRIKQALGVCAEENMGSIGLKLAAIAIGDYDLYVNPATHCSSWDTCAPQIILEQAGGTMTDIYGSPLRYCSPDTLRHTSGIVASNGPLHKAAIEKLSDLFPRRK